MTNEDRVIPKNKIARKINARKLDWRDTKFTVFTTFTISIFHFRLPLKIVGFSSQYHSTEAEQQGRGGFGYLTQVPQFEQK